MNQVLLEALCEHLGHQVTLVDDGAEALEVVVRTQPWIPTWRLVSWRRLPGAS